MAPPQSLPELPPCGIIKRKKRGFAVNVVDDWMRNSMNSKFGSDLSDPQSKIFQVLRHDSVQKMISEHQSGRHDHHKVLFSLALMEEWLRVNHS